MIIPIVTRKMITASANLSAKLKLPDHGPSLLYRFTSNAIIATAANVTQVLPRRTKVVATTNADSHQVTG